MGKRTVRYDRKVYLKYRWEVYCRSLVASALKTGKLIKEPCEVCGELKVQAHHDDYNYPLRVRWLCMKCHKQWHKTHKVIRSQKTIRTMKCWWCKKEFTPKARAQHYCCQDCAKLGIMRNSKRVWKEREERIKRERRQRLGVCAYCGKQFKAFGMGKYCSDECRHEVRLQQKRADYQRNIETYRAYRQKKRKEKNAMQRYCGRYYL